MPLALCNRRNDREVNWLNNGKPLVFLLWLSLFLPGLGLSSQNLDVLRKEFLAAERVLNAGDLKKYTAISSSLKNYPLYPYLEFQALQLGLRTADSSQIDAFITTYSDSPLAKRMRRLWLTELAQRGKWWTYLVFYKPGMGETLQCNYLTALLETGKITQALDQAEAIWLHPRSRPKACDTILETWIDAGRLTPSLAWKRVELAMQASQGSFANYLKRHLSTEQVGGLTAWRKLRRQPELITHSQPLLKDNPSINTIILDGFKRLVKKDIDTALLAWPKLQANYSFTPGELYQGTRTLMLGLIRNDHKDALAKLQTVTPSAKDHYLHESRLRGALKKQAWPQVLKWIALLPDPLKQSDRWRYWQARALSETGDPTRAKALFATLAKSRSYHGFLAADLLSEPYRYDATPLDLQQPGIDKLAKRPALMRARELFQLGRFTDARREWQMAIRSMNRLDLKRVSKLAQSWGWHDRAIFTLARTGYWDDLDLRFPLEHQTLVTEKSSTTDLDNAWIFAVIRQESAFSSDARSPVGAMGLMQLMPATAKFIARKEKLSPPKRSQLTRPELNITLGTAYLNHVYQKLGEHQVLATAAYNAGPSNVMKWLPDTTLPADIWIELIPFSETRRYTERVLSYAAIYDQRLKQPLQRLSARMPPVHPRSQLAAKAISGKNAAL